MHRGYTKRWRKRWDKDYCKDHLLWVMMDYFIDNANYKDSNAFIPNVGVVPLKRGQHIFGTRQLSVKLGVDRQRIRTKLKILKNIDFLTLDPTRNYTIATIINYDIYQPSDSEANPQTNQQLTHSQPTANPRLTTPKKDKKDKKDKKNKRAWPTDFKLNDQMRSYAIDHGIAPNKVDAFFIDFRDWAFANGATYIDWVAAFRTRVGKAQEWGKRFLASPGDLPKTFKTTEQDDLERWKKQIGMTR